MRKRTILLWALSLFAAVSVAWAAPINPKEARELLAASSAAGPASANKGPLLLDVRTLQEFNEVRIPGAVLLPVDRINAATAAAAIGPLKDRTVIVYCRSGNRSRSAVSALASR
jgi:rhodanese-related sulfurtransferase